MSWFFVEPAACVNGEVRLDADDSHHWLRVLRAKPGETFTAVCGGHALRAEYQGTLQGQVVGRVVQEETLAAEPPIAVTVFQGLAKGEKMEWVIQKCTELGATTFVPVATARSVVQLTGAKAAERCRRWQKIAREAAQQSRRGAIPLVMPVTPWSEAAARAADFDLALVLWEELAGANGVGLKALLQDGSNSPLPGAGQHLHRVAIYVGPEGGLEAQEADQAAAAGARLVRLGPRILRTETAALAALAALLYAVGDLGA